MAQLIIEVPDAIAAQIGAALRAAYPDVTAGLTTDGQVARAVFAWLVANIVAQHAVDQVRQVKQAAVTAAQADLTASVALAQKQSWALVQSIINTPVTPPSTTDTGATTP